MSPFLAELFGTAILVLLGDGVVANVLLNKSKGQNSGWIVITTGWALAVTVGVCANANATSCGNSRAAARRGIATGSPATSGRSTRGSPRGAARSRRPRAVRAALPAARDDRPAIGPMLSRSPNGRPPMAPPARRARRDDKLLRPTRRRLTMRR